MGEIVNFIVETVGALGYFGIFIMMLLESSFFPFPSEVVMIPAGYLAYKGEMNLFIVIFMGILGSIAGALLNYYLAMHFGRAFLIKYGRYFFIKEETIAKTESFFKEHGHISTFSGRLVPAVRQYISLPAGIAKMNLKTFTIYTAAGAGIWVTILALLGYFIGENEEMLKEYLHIITAGVLLLLVAGIAIYIRQKRKSRDREL